MITRDQNNVNESSVFSIISRVDINFDPLDNQISSQPSSVCCYLIICRLQNWIGQGDL